MTQSAYAGKGFKNLVAQSAARRTALEQQRSQLYQDQLAQLEKQATANNALLSSQVATAQQAIQQGAEPSQVVSPLQNPDSDFAKFLQSKGTTLEEYVQMPVARRQQEYAEPYLNERWMIESSTRPELMRLEGKSLEREKQRFKNMGLNAYAANFDAMRDAEGFLGKVGNFAGDVVEGAGGFVDAVGGITKSVLGNDSVIGGGLNKIGTFVSDFGRGLATEAEQDAERYMQDTLQRGEYGELAKLVVNNPLMAVGEVGQMLGGVGGYGAAAKGVTKLASKGLKLANAADKADKVVSAGSKLARSMPTYSAVQVGGQVANELDERGIDLTTVNGRLAVLASALGGAAMTKLTPSNIENQIMKMGLSKEAGKILTREMVQDATKMGLLKGPAKYGLGLAKNAGKSSLNEGIEELGQEGIGAFFAQALLDDSGNVRSWADVPEDVKEQVIRRAVSGGVMGAGLGAGFGTARNMFNKQGDTEKAQQIAQSEQHWKEQDAAEAARVKAEQDKLDEEKALRMAEEELAAKAQKEAQKAEEERIKQEQEKLDKLVQHEMFIKRAKERERIMRDYDGEISAQDVDKILDVREFDEHLNAVKQQAESVLDREQLALLNEQWDASTVRGSRVAALENAGLGEQVRDARFVGKNDYLPHVKKAFGQFTDGTLSEQAQLAYDSVIESANTYADNNDLIKLAIKADTARQLNDEATVLKSAREAQNIRNKIKAAEALVGVKPLADVDIAAQPTNAMTMYDQLNVQRAGGALAKKPSAGRGLRKPKKEK